MLINGCRIIDLPNEETVKSSEIQLVTPNRSFKLKTSLDITSFDIESEFQRNLMDSPLFSPETTLQTTKQVEDDETPTIEKPAKIKAISPFSSPSKPLNNISEPSKLFDRLFSKIKNNSPSPVKTKSETSTPTVALETLITKITHNKKNDEEANPYSPTKKESVNDSTPKIKAKDAQEVLNSDVDLRLNPFEMNLKQPKEAKEKSKRKTKKVKSPFDLSKKVLDKDSMLNKNTFNTPVRKNQYAHVKSRLYETPKNMVITPKHVKGTSTVRKGQKDSSKRRVKEVNKTNSVNSSYETPKRYNVKSKVSEAWSTKSKSLRADKTDRNSNNSTNGSVVSSKRVQKKLKNNRNSSSTGEQVRVDDKINTPRNVGLNRSKDTSTLNVNDKKRVGSQKRKINTAITIDTTGSRSRVAPNDTQMKRSLSQTFSGLNTPLSKNNIKSFSFQETPNKFFQPPSLIEFQPKWTLKEEETDDKEQKEQKEQKEREVDNVVVKPKVLVFEDTTDHAKVFNTLMSNTPRKKDECCLDHNLLFEKLEADFLLEQEEERKLETERRKKEKEQQMVLMKVYLQNLLLGISDDAVDEVEKKNLELEKQKEEQLEQRIQRSIHFLAKGGELLKGVTRGKPHVRYFKLDESCKKLIWDSKSSKNANGITIDSITAILVHRFENADARKLETKHLQFSFSLLSSEKNLALICPNTETLSKWVRSLEFLTQISADFFQIPQITE
eukprot:TRINITY_DN7013_c0_g1_i1.p1 TRINITY_DN7013_c0_g1~~TRINITY_DN7013_c0_g1_i1.p1  ORF type:complete len:781 (-),score=208.06 TRINITY_DN7013_c0_g1_i1:2-2173(-)